MMLEAHLDTCLSTVVQGEDLAERERMLGEVASIFEMVKKYKYSIEGEFHDNGN
jgi:hypothetical protein